MNIQEKILASRYAQAFLNVYGTTFSLDDYYHIKDAYEFLKDNRSLSSHFKLPRLERAKKEVVQKIFQEFHIPASINALVDLLLEHQRLYLLKDVFGLFLREYRQRNNYLAFTFETSHQLTEQRLLTVLSRSMTFPTCRSYHYTRSVS